LQTEVERELVLKCMSGDARYYEPLVRAYEPAGRRIALGILGNAEDARDALQEAFVKAWANLERFDVKRPFGPWFYQILRNHCRDMLRSRTSRFQREVVDEHIESRPTDHEAGPERGRERSAAAELLWQGLERIGPDHREILVLKELEQLTYPEIAAVLAIPEGTVASRLFHARHALRAALEQLGIIYP
jgi:RNA polymerase sigma-70 factor, ECF subfamily